MVLALDQSRYHTGWAIMEDGEILKGGVISVPAKAGKSPVDSVLYQVQALTAAGADWNDLTLTLELVLKPTFQGGDRFRGNPGVSLAETLGAWRMWARLRGVPHVLQGARDVRTQLGLPTNGALLQFAMLQYAWLPWRRDVVMTDSAIDRNMDMAMAIGHALMFWQVYLGHGRIKKTKPKKKRGAPR